MPALSDEPLRTPPTFVSKPLVHHGVDALWRGDDRDFVGEVVWAKMLESLPLSDPQPSPVARSRIAFRPKSLVEMTWSSAVRQKSRGR
jgi:hypothetical protein